jgi:hypothetical protein
MAAAAVRGQERLVEVDPVEAISEERRPAGE